MTLFVLLIMSGAFRGVWRRTVDGLLWGGVLLLVAILLAGLFPDTDLGTVVSRVFPFPVRL